MSMEEYQPKVELKQPSPSVLLRLLGIDDFPMRQTVVKKARVLSDDYLQRIACIGVRQKRAEQYSFNMPTDEERECEHVFNVVHTFKRDNYFRMSSRKRAANLDSSEEKMQFTRQKVMEPAHESPDERFWDLNECLEGPPKVADMNVDKILRYHGRPNCVSNKLYGLKDVPGNLRWRQRPSRYGRAQGFSVNRNKAIFLQPGGVGASISGQEETNAANCSALYSGYLDAPWLGEDQHLEFQSLLQGNLCVKTREGNTSASVSKRPIQRSRFSKQAIGETGQGMSRFQSPKSNWKTAAKVQQVEPDKNSFEAAKVVADAEIEVVKQPIALPEKQYESCYNILSERDEVSSFHAVDTIVQQAVSDKESLSSYRSFSELDSLISMEESFHRSPDSVLLPLGQQEISFSSSYFKSLGASLSDMQSDHDQSEMSEVYSEGSCNVSGDEDSKRESVSEGDEDEHDMQMFRAEESRDFSYLVDVLTEAGFLKDKMPVDSDSWAISSDVFETLEKKYGEQITWNRSERRLLFDRVNSGLKELLQASLGIPAWRESVARRVMLGQDEEAIEDELWMILACQEKESTADSEKILERDDKWMDLTGEIQVIGIQIEHSLINELVEDALA